MTIRPMPSSISIFSKVESHHRQTTTRSTTVENTSNPTDVRLATDSGRQQSGMADHGIGQRTGDFNYNLPVIDRLDDVFAKFDEAEVATEVATEDTNERLRLATKGFQSQFANTAHDADAFESLMQTAFGDEYDKNAAETIRQQTLAGDFSWMPDVKVVDRSSLADTSKTQESGGGLAAYDSESDTIYLSEELLTGDTRHAVDVLTEEVGHAIDSRINTFDSVGDEGELFAKLVAGESLSVAQLQAVRSENDHGTIIIDGKTVEVEYFSFKSLGKAISNAGQVLVDVATDGVNMVGSAVGNGVKAVGGEVSGAVNRVGDFLSDTVNSVGDTVTDGLDFINNNVVSPFLNTIPVVGPWLNNHIIQPGFGLMDTAVNVVTNIVDSGIDFSTHALSGNVDILTNLFAGDFKGVWNSAVDTVQKLGQDIAGFAIESAVIPIKGIATFINEAFNLTEVRGLRPEELTYLKTIYGDSLDYDEIRIQTGGGVEAFLGLDPHAIGNHIYIPEDKFNPDGSLTVAGSESGLDLLAHEAGHVWQFQNDGASYIGDAILSYGQSHLEQGNRNGAYDFTTAINEMKPWEAMTPDEQAEIAMVIGEALEADKIKTGSAIGELTEDNLVAAIDNHNGRNRGPIELSEPQFNYLKNIYRLLQAG